MDQEPASFIHRGSIFRFQYVVKKSVIDDWASLIDNHTSCHLNNDADLMDNVAGIFVCLFHPTQLHHPFAHAWYFRTDSQTPEQFCASNYPDYVMMAVFERVL